MRQIGIYPMDNGMTLYYFENLSANASGIGVRAGSIHDPPGKVGMAHFTEHVISSKSRTHPDPDATRLICRKRLGGPDGDINIRTDRYSTFYGHLDIRRRKHMSEVFDIMASYLHPITRILEEDDVMTEKGAVHNEYNLRGVDIMEMLVDDEMHRLMYDRNPARNRVDCELPDLASMVLGDVQKFVRKWYVPKNMFIVIIGPKPEIAEKIAKHYFGDWIHCSAPKLGYDHSDDFPVLEQIKFCEITRDIHQYHCGIGFPTETYLSPDAEALDVLGRALEARLVRRLRDDNKKFDGGVYRVYVETPRSFAHGMIWVSFATVSKEFEAKAEEIVIEEAGKLRADLITLDELDSARDWLVDQYYTSFGYYWDNLLEMVIAATCNGDPDLKMMHGLPKRLKKVSRRKLREIANKYFTQNFARVLIKPNT